MPGTAVNVTPEPDACQPVGPLTAPLDAAVAWTQYWVAQFQAILELAVSVTGPGMTAGDIQRRIYKKTIGDEKRNILNSDAEIFMKGVFLLSDNRIGPKEVRRERFQFPISSRGPFKVSSTVVYLYMPYMLDQKLIEMTMDSATQSVGPLK